MKRLLVPACAVFVLVLLGCRSRAPLTDPFVGQTCIAPPGTGAGTAPGEPYYGGTAAPSFSPGPAVPGTGPGVGTLQAAPSPGVNPATLPQGTGYQSQLAPPVAAAGVEQPLMASNDRPGSPVAGRQRYTRVLQPRAAAAQTTNASLVAQPQPRAVPAQAAAPTTRPDIRTLPDAKRSSSAEPARFPVAEAGSARQLASEAKWVDPSVRPASAEEPIDDAAPAATSATEADLADRYQHSADYTRLKGKLEYSQIDQQWKLRYIPADGETDDYGGSVVVADAKALSGYERGDFVEVRGQLGKPADGETRFAPKYHIAEIRRIAR